MQPIQGRIGNRSINSQWRRFVRLSFEGKYVRLGAKALSFCTENCLWIKLFQLALASFSYSCSGCGGEDFFSSWSHWCLDFYYPQCTLVDYPVGNHLLVLPFLFPVVFYKSMYVKCLFKISYICLHFCLSILKSVINFEISKPLISRKNVTLKSHNLVWMH